METPKTLEDYMKIEDGPFVPAEDGLPINRRSFLITGGFDHPAARGQLAGAGLKGNDRFRAQVAVVHTGFEQNTCNMHLYKFAKKAERAINKNPKLRGWEYPVGGVSDGILMGTDGMRSSLITRDLIADLVQAHVYGHPYDAMVAIPGCDKQMPAVIMAMGRLNIPSLMIYGGTIIAGCHNGQPTDIVTGFEAKGTYLAGKLSKKELVEIIEGSDRPGETGICPGEGACGGMYTANTMASAIEALGMSLPGSSSYPANSKEKQRELKNMGQYIETLVMKQILPRQIMTKRAFENAITIVQALGGSTNAVMHLIAMARSAEVELNVDDFQRIGQETPLIADMKPSGKYLMEDLHHVGGTPSVLKLLLRNGNLHGDCLTVTGKTLEENLAEFPDLKKGQRIIYEPSNPISPTGHIKILYGNLAPTSAVAKITGKEGTYFKGPANVFDSEQEALNALKNGKIKYGDVVVTRYEGPRGAPGMPEQLDFTSAAVKLGYIGKIAIVTDARMSGGSHGFIVNHVTPEAAVGGSIALIQNGDIIEIDAVKLTINLLVDDKILEAGKILEARKAQWKPPQPKYDLGVFARAERTMSQANYGAVLDLPTLKT